MLIEYAGSIFSICRTVFRKNSYSSENKNATLEKKRLALSFFFRRILKKPEFSSNSKFQFYVATTENNSPSFAMPATPGQLHSLYNSSLSDQPVC